MNIFQVLTVLAGLGNFLISLLSFILDLIKGFNDKK